MTSTEISAPFARRQSCPEVALRADRFADVEVLRFRTPQFETLPLRRKQYLYHLAEAALMGRDIVFDQNNRYNLAVRRALEAIYRHYDGDRSTPDFENLTTYLKQVWFANGIHHHYSGDKFIPTLSLAFFKHCIRRLDVSRVPVRNGQTVDEWLTEITPVIFDPHVMAKRTVQSGEGDIIALSANNYYGEGVTMVEAEAFYTGLKNPDDTTPVSHGLNSRLVKENGALAEKVWKTGGLYTQAIEAITAALEKALAFAEGEKQQAVVGTLIDYYHTGNLKTFDAYAMLWVEELESDVDFVNGFIETYGDALGLKASWESIVYVVDKKATRRTKIISDHAQWFELHSPVSDRFKNQSTRGVSAKVVAAAMLGGDCYPATPIGINLPNTHWIRQVYGSKSVTIENISAAYDAALQGSGFTEEFVWSDVECDLLKQYGLITGLLHTDLHECVGHGSGIILPGVDPDGLKAYASTIEEARADLFALYYLADVKLVELGLLPNSEAYKSEYYRFMMNGLMTQLARIEQGKHLEEAHMRNRQLIAYWVYEKGKPENVTVLKRRDGKTYVVVNDYAKLRVLFGELLTEIQRIKSEGDWDAGKYMVETYGVKVNRTLHDETLARYAKLNLAPYKGFVNPVLREVRNHRNQVVDIVPDYSESYVNQMLRYSEKYSFLPTYN